MAFVLLENEALDCDLDCVKVSRKWLEDFYSLAHMTQLT